MKHKKKEKYEVNYTSKTNKNLQPIQVLDAIYYLLKIYFFNN